MRRVSLFFLCYFSVLRLVSLSLSALKNRHFPDILSLLFRCLYSVSAHAPDVASRPFLRRWIRSIRRLIIREQMRRVSLFFPCSVSAFSLLCLTSVFRLCFVSLSFVSHFSRPKWQVMTSYDKFAISFLRRTSANFARGFISSQPLTLPLFEKAAQIASKRITETSQPESSDLPRFFVWF